MPASLHNPVIVITAAERARLGVTNQEVTSVIRRTFYVNNVLRVDLEVFLVSDQTSAGTITRTSR